MKGIITIGILFFAILQLNSQRRFDVQFMLDGRVRESIIVLPSTPPPAGGYPVVFMLHGTSGDGLKFYNISGWKELGEEENFITVFPSSLRWCFTDDGIEEHNTRWVNGNVTDFPCSGPPQDYVDDVKFLKVLAKRIADTFPVNEKMIFSSGFSNGCSMIHKLAIDAGDVFAAVAGTSSPLAAGDSSWPVNRIPVWFMVGSLDDRFIKPPFTELPFGGDSILGYLKIPLNRALVCQGLRNEFIKTEKDSSHTYQFLNNLPGEISKPYIFTLLKGMTHQYPNGDNYPLSAPRLFWEFFKRSVAVSTKQVVTSSNEILALPNPSNDLIEISIPEHHGNYHWNLYDTQGNLRLKGNQAKGESVQIKKSELGTGLYLFRIDLGNSALSRKIIFN
ncbi:MAG: T9SS type A sorting domain-containing protein [Saprospiraceae bacterium]|nr:T9SS type A sorting domain-containing protein [Candidatus Vicinibacter affinis]